MSKLTVIDLENFILEGEFERFNKIPPNTTLNEESIRKAVQKYKDEYVDKGDGLGYLNDGFLTIPTDLGEQISEEQKDPAFMVLNIGWEPYTKSVVGRIVILDSEDGLKIKGALKTGANAYISSSETETYDRLNKEQSRLEFCIAELKNYKISLLSLV